MNSTGRDSTIATSPPRAIAGAVRAWRRLGLAALASLVLHGLLVQLAPTHPLSTSPGAVTTLSARIVSPARPAASSNGVPVAATPATLPAASAKASPMPVAKPTLKAIEPDTPDTIATKPFTKNSLADTQGGVIGIAAPVDGTFYTWREVDRPAQMQTIDLPQTPANVTAENIQVSVSFELWIDERGTVERVDILRAEPAGYVEVLLKSHFEGRRVVPALRQGRPVKYRGRFDTEFKGDAP